MEILKKIQSRKFLIAITNYITAVVLLYFDKLDSLYFTIIVLGTSIIYLFIEGSIDFKNIKKIEFDNIKYEINEVDYGNNSKSRNELFAGNLQNKNDTITEQESIR